MAWKGIGETKVIFDGRKLKHIKVTCRCGHSFVEEVPGELLEMRTVVVLECDQCQQHYGLIDGKLARLNANMLPEKVIKAEGVVPATADEAIDAIDRAIEELQKKGIAVQNKHPDSSKIN